MQPHQKRVQEEAADLDGKIERLDKFMEGAVFANLRLEERNDLDLQCGAMKLYAHCLQSRIERFD